MRRDTGLEALLDLDGWIADQGHGYWIKVEARRVDPTPEIPHGIRYSLKLHDPNGTRILGYDNAHGVKRPRKYKYAGHVLAYDHKHRHSEDKGIAYEFQDADQLMKDFFADVDRVLQEVKRR